MNQATLKQLLEALAAGYLSTDEAMQKLRHLPFESGDFATVDHHRALRCGFPEVIYSPGKTAEQIRGIFSKLVDAGGPVLATRTDEKTFQLVRQDHPDAVYHELARCITWRGSEGPEPGGQVAIVAAGTSDLPVAEEARVTAEIMDQKVSTHYDVGVAGLHRLLACGEQLQRAKVIVVVAGMEGALPSVVGGLVGVPVIAVPTSVGYGASFGGAAALLGMLNSCASNVCVVNIDNGFSGGYIAAMINRQSRSE